MVLGEFFKFKFTKIVILDKKILIFMNKFKIKIYTVLHFFIIEFLFCITLSRFNFRKFTTISVLNIYGINLTFIIFRI